MHLQVREQQTAKHPYALWLYGLIAGQGFRVLKPLDSQEDGTSQQRVMPSPENV